MSAEPATIESHHELDIATVAEHINKLHKEARSQAVSAVEKAVECGNALIEVKASLNHGEWQDWIAKNCDFEARTAQLYMKAAKSAADGLPFTSLRQLYGPSAEVEPHERRPADKERDTETLTGLEADIVSLNEALEGVSTPVMSPEEFVAQAGSQFLSEKAASKLNWLVKLFDVLAAKDGLPGK